MPKKTRINPRMYQKTLIYVKKHLYIKTQLYF